MLRKLQAYEDRNIYTFNMENIMNHWELILLKREMEENIKNPTWDQIKMYLNQVDGNEIDG